MKTQALQETLDTKRTFVRHVSHEIRTPLNVVMSGLDLLSAMACANVEMEDLIADIKSACTTAIDILNDLLSYEKLDSNLLALERSDCDFGDMVNKVFSFFQIQARYSHTSLTFINLVSEDRLPVVNGDVAKLTQVVRNLLSNALKFTPDGGSVVMTLSVDATTQRVRLEVQDSGPGIAREDRRKLFNEVVQFNAKELQGGQGSGLGLFLSQRIIAMHDGVIGVDLDWEGVGSKFYLELIISEMRQRAATKPVSTSTEPVSEASNSTKDQAPEADDKHVKLRILLVDDVALCRKFHSRIVEKYCDVCEEAANGIQAVAMLKASIERGQPYHGVLMDNSMPFMNGNTAAKQMRDLGYTGKIFGITGNAFQADIDDFILHGANEVFVKPVTADRYRYLIGQIYDSLGSYS